MNSFLLKKSGLVCLLVTAGLAVHADSLYDNLTTPAGTFNAQGNQIGDQVILSDLGVGANITDFSFELYSIGVAPTAEYTVSLLSNDGTGGAPLSTLWSDTYNFGASYPTGTLVTYSGLSIDVPHSFTWAISFSALGDAAEAGLILSTATGPSIGANYTDYWMNDGTWHLNYIPDNTINFLASFSGTPIAVPEPSSAALLGLGAVGLLFWSRRSFRLSR